MVYFKCQKSHELSQIHLSREVFNVQKPYLSKTGLTEAARNDFSTVG